MRFYLKTNFCGNQRGLSIFCVDLAWNDPGGISGLDLIQGVLEYKAPSTASFHLER